MLRDADGFATTSVALRLTAVLLLLRPQGPPLVVLLQLALGTLALVFPAALASAALWYTATVAVALRIASDWPLADNHIYLLAYWCLAIALALGSSAPSAALARAARWLIACAMGLAVLWKGVLSPDYIDGRFFRMTLLVDERFEDIVRIAGDMDRAQIERHRQALMPLADGAELALDDSLVEPAAFHRLALALTWGGLLWETALAAVFVAPLAYRWRWLRHALLLGFCIAVYPVAPVAGFGWLLLSVGLSQASSEAPSWRWAYVGVWLFVLAVTELPWAGWVAELLTRVEPT